LNIPLDLFLVSREKLGDLFIMGPMVSCLHDLSLANY